MGRLYSGNLMDFRGACERIAAMDLKVETRACYHVHTRVHCMAIRVTSEGGGEIASLETQSFDEDVLYLEVTGWLRRVGEELKRWK